MYGIVLWVCKNHCGQGSGWPVLGVLHFWPMSVPCRSPALVIKRRSSSHSATIASLCNKEFPFSNLLRMHRQSEPRAGSHQRNTRSRNVSLLTQANHTVRGARKQPPNWGATHAASEYTTHTSNHTACHQGRQRRPARHPPRAQQVPALVVVCLCIPHHRVPL